MVSLGVQGPVGALCVCIFVFTLLWFRGCVSHDAWLLSARACVLTGVLIFIRFVYYVIHVIVYALMLTYMSSVAVCSR